MQAQALMVLQQQQEQPGFEQVAAAPALPCSRASAVLPLPPGAGNSLLVHPQPLLEVAAVETEAEQNE